MSSLPEVRTVLAVCAHPDDESFGLGAVLSAFAERGARTSVLCFTHGEASTLGTGDLREIRSSELATASDALGVSDVTLLGYPDGALAAQPPGALAAHVHAIVADLLLVFDEEGVTGHPDHVAATGAALADGRPVLAWTIPRAVAGVLNETFGTAFVGRYPGEADLVLAVDRTRQRRAIACHASQSNAVLERRLELLGGVEWLRWLRR